MFTEQMIDWFIDYDQPSTSRVIGVALAMIHANGRSAVDTSVMLSIQLWYKVPLYVNGNEQFDVGAVIVEHKYTEIKRKYNIQILSNKVDRQWKYH